MDLWNGYGIVQAGWTLWSKARECVLFSSVSGKLQNVG